MKNFAHLHVHTEYSLLDGATRVNTGLFERCEKLGITSIAMTDHGNMFGAIEFMKQAVKYTDPKADPFEFMKERREFKVKPIFGCEIYMCENMHERVAADGGVMPKYNHLVLLAKNLTGYQNLSKLVSKAYIDGLYYKPRADYEALEQYCEGLIALSACNSGIIPQCLLAGDYQKAEYYVKKFKSLFGEDFYIEIQNHRIQEQLTVMPRLVELARKNDVKIVATNDVHYLKQSDAHLQKVLMSISFRDTISYEDDDSNGNDTAVAMKESKYFPQKEFYLKSYDEMSDMFPSLTEALDNTLEVAAKCDCYFFQKQQLLPKFRIDNGSEYLRAQTYAGLEKKYSKITPQISARADYELDTINKLGFVDYFLIVADFIKHAESVGIPVGPGRGSGAGSIVAYATGITKIDPLKYALIFERFLNPERVTNPDFDIDFCVDRRDEVIDYVREIYGDKSVAQIVTFSTMAAKAAIKDVGRVYNHPYAEVDKITKLIPFSAEKISIKSYLGLTDRTHIIPELREIYDNDVMANRILTMASEIEGMPRQIGMHAAGVIICQGNVSDHVPLAKNADGAIVTQFDMIECEELGLLKMDFLGLRTLTDIKKALDEVEKNRGVKVDFYNMEYDDQNVYKMIGDGDTDAVFQLESEGMKRFMRDLKPSTFEDIIAGVALYRPGPMDSIPQYVENKRNPLKVHYTHQMLKPILSVTYGVTIYQEQVIEIVRKLAGYSMGRADNVRRMMSKKQYDKMEKERETFIFGNGKDIPGCINNGVDEKTAHKIYDDLISFANYGFNKSHAAAYAYLAYQTAYLKHYYTVEFFAAVLNNRITNISDLTKYLNYLKINKIEVLPPSINRSDAGFTVDNGAIRIGMAAIKNVGITVIEAIVSERRRGGEFTDFVQFVKRMDNITLNRRLLESLIYAGAFDCFGLNRSVLVAVYDTVMERANKDKEARLAGQFSFFDVAQIKDEFVYPKLDEYSDDFKLKKEKEVSGVYLSGHPLSRHSARFDSFALNTSMIVQGDEQGEGVAEDTLVTLGGIITEASRRITKSNKELGVARLEDMYGTVELLAAGGNYTKLKNVWQNDKLVTVTGRVAYRDERASIWVNEMTEWDTSPVEPVQKVCCYYSLKDNNCTEQIMEILEAYPGRDKCYVKNSDDDKLFALPKTFDACPLALMELCGLLGADNVKKA